MSNQNWRDELDSRVNAACACKVGPGKFEGEDALTFLAWQQVLLGGSDTTTGSEGSLTDWFRAPLNFDADAGVVEAAKAYGYCDACIAEALASDCAGLRVWEDSNGFVYSRYYSTREAFDKALARAETADEAAGEDA